MAQQTLPQSEVYQGQFGEFTVTDNDRQSVIIYRVGLMVAALCFAVASILVLFYPSVETFRWITPLFSCYAIALGVSLLTIHIYMGFLHRTLQAFWLIGCISSFCIGHLDPEPFAVTVYTQPLTLFGVGFIFAALTGIFFKEAFCFNRLETKVLTFTVPLLLLGHLAGVLPIIWERGLLATWAILFFVFAVRKVIQAVPPDIGDKSVFEYLKSQRAAKAS
ncbi:DUF2301 domain-containing membrane protein [Calothrix sp. PCC 6303]|uniref:DUF2301 domain-containing membrane protein n=1 Tax=Calothrix sp. PCC 6303 TaxID=1170562 RepID=UPI0002A0499D|nr:DUF2301 domain-containing membrane protein [Calothrix sp. PCC 6303]AFZ01885.1 Protein of unknown function DUF2301, transmembrane [Calothrix sp. PCC 6303]